MIVAPQPFVLAAAGSAADLKFPRIGWHTHTRNALASSVSVSGETANGPKDAPLRPDTYSFWEPDALPATWTFDFGEIKEAVNYVGVAAHTLATARCAVTVETSLDGVSWSQFSDDALPAKGRPLLFLDTDRSAKKVRVSLEGAVVPRVGVIYVGTALVMERSLYGGHTPISLARDTELMQNRSRGGQILGQQIRRTGVRNSAAFRNLTAEWVRSTFDPFAVSARRYPYFFAWRPSAFPLEVGYVQTPGPIVPVNMGKRTFMEVSWEMSGPGDDDE